MDLSRAGEGPSYRLSDNDPGQSGDVDPKTTSIVGGCNETKDYIQELKEEPTPDIGDTRNVLFAEVEKEDPGSIDISCLSLSIDLEEITVLREIFQGKRK